MLCISHWGLSWESYALLSDTYFALSSIDINAYDTLQLTTIAENQFNSAQTHSAAIIWFQQTLVGNVNIKMVSTIYKIKF